MDVRVILLLLIVGGSCCSGARILTTPHFSIHTHILSAIQIIHHQPKWESVIMEGSGRNDKVCELCEEFTTMALDYIANNKTQNDIISILHESCSKVLNFKQQCITLVDYYAPLFFLEVSSMQPEAFCQKVDLCEQVVAISQHLSKNSCSLCHRFVMEALLKLKDPDTQLNIVELLLKACDAVEGYAKKCKRLVFEYAPAILINAEEFLETNDICTILHACDSAASGEEQTITSEKPVIAVF